MNTYAQAEALAEQIIDAFEADMRRGPNVCACCGRRVICPCAMGAAALEGLRLVVYPLCAGCVERAQANPAARRALDLRVRTYIRRAFASDNANLSVSI